MLPVEALCDALAVSPSTYYRRRNPKQKSGKKKGPPRTLSESERKHILDTLNTERFANMAPAEVYAVLLREGDYLCSIRTMYRVLKDNQQVRERRKIVHHGRHSKPELLATGPNQVWSWDITKLRGPKKWTYYYLYVVMDIYSRYVVGWMVSTRERGTLAKKFLYTCLQRQGIVENQLTIHSDRGAAMTSTSLALLLSSLGVVKSHSRPHTSNDNPFSESQFKTLKNRPQYPDRFQDEQHAVEVCERLFYWYNEEHHHEGIGLHTPSDVHYGRAQAIQVQRAETLANAYKRNPERFPNGMPKPPSIPAEVGINLPKKIPTAP